MSIHISVGTFSNFREAIQIQIPLKRAEFSSAKVFRQNRCCEIVNVGDTECLAGFRPRYDIRFVGILFSEFGLALEHFIKPSWKLLRHTSFASARITECWNGVHSEVLAEKKYEAT